MTRFLIAATLLVAASVPAFAETTQLSPDRYRVDEGVEFQIANSGSSSFLFTWTDISGTVSAVADPTLVLTAGETYSFRRTTSSHPFIITDDSLPVSGGDGTWSRTTFDAAVLDTSTLMPISEFTADPAPTADFISWTPNQQDVGTYYYTCRVVSHASMTGAIEVESPQVEAQPVGWSAVKALFLDGN